ncbi:5'-3' exonuclease [Pseudonocardia spinosispora]|uniref:5'-3' exonuclease n=1 Tax=Pseudonocardia spinosispora TaxID=103441 RepID=UPI000428F9FB|nr:5'-3' exonuclease H3TH domain-containing protein [Pseudonocardia spinosispora]
MSGSERVVLVVDGNSLVHRAYHSQARTGFRSGEGQPRWAVRGLLSQLVAAVDRVGPDAVVVGFDDPESSLRRTTWPSYKAHRTDKPSALVEQLARAVEVIGELGIPVVVPSGLEADDVLASVARQAPLAGASTVVVTSDRDAFGLIDSHTRLLRVINGGVEASPMLTPERLVMMLGVRPEQYPDFAALRGDPSDNLPGVRGVGPVIAARLLGALGSAEVAFADLESGGGRVVEAVGPTVAARLAEPGARRAWELNRAVMTMHTDVPVDLDAGRLPLATAVVRQAFLTHELHWTTAAALRALAHEESEDPRPPSIPLETGWPPSHQPRRHKRLPVKTVTDQLSLF